jgi:hypothetical protein
MKARANTLRTKVRGHLLFRVGVLAMLMMLLVLTLVCTSAAWATTLNVTNTNDSGIGSLRAAIEQANANAGADEIMFADGVSDTITLASNLPAITDAAGLVIDGGGDVTVSGLPESGFQRAGGEVGPGAVLALRNVTILGFRIKNSGTFEVTNTTITRNSEQHGGGIYNSGTLKVTNSTISGNVGGDFFPGWNIYNSDDAGGTATLASTIMDQTQSCAGTITDGGFNIDSGTTCGFTQATGSLSKTNPLMVRAPDNGTLLADNGGPTQTVALQPDSPAVDLASADACPPPATDQRGVERPQGEACDAGAFELEQEPTLPDTTPPSVTSTSPTANATEVAPTANVRATFSEEMKASTIDGTTFQLFKKGTTTQIAAQVSYNADTDTAKLDPTKDLSRGVAYKAVVSTWAKDVADNRLDQDSSASGFQQMRWFFRVDD